MFKLVFERYPDFRFFNPFNFISQDGGWEETFVNGKSDKTERKRYRNIGFHFVGYNLYLRTDWRMFTQWSI